MSTSAIGRYRLLRDLGQGTTAHVYLARDPSSGRQVAVKLLTQAYTAAPGFPAAFESALQALVGLDHPYLVPTLDFGSEDEQFYVVQRYMPGGTLADRLDGRPMLLSEVLVILERLAAALDAAHTAGVFHGDFNPAHVLFDINGRAFITDLGLAPLLQGAGTATQPGLPGLPGALPSAGWERFVTPAYMSPEQAAGESIDGRCDVYALGVIIFEMLTGRQPYVAVTPEGVTRQQMESAVPSLSDTALAQLVLPPEFNQVIARALAKDRDQRYPTAGVLVEAMRAMFLEAPEPAAPSPLVVPDLAPSALTDLAEPGEPVSPPPPPPSTLAAFEPTGREPAEILRAEPPEPPPAPPRTLWLGLGGIGLFIVIALLALARWANVGGWGLPPTPTATATFTATATHTATAVPSDTPTITPSATPTVTPSPTPTRTRRPTRTPSRTPTATVTRTSAPTQPPFTATPTNTVAAAAPLPLPATATP
jgi:serine/threonine protein kinase